MTLKNPFFFCMTLFLYIQHMLSPSVLESDASYASDAIDLVISFLASSSNIIVIVIAEHERYLLF